MATTRDTVWRLYSVYNDRGFDEVLHGALLDAMEDTACPFLTRHPDGSRGWTLRPVDLKAWCEYRS